MALSGFSSGKVAHTPIPDSFFHELLPEIDHLGELKVSLYAFWRLHQMEGSIRFFRREELLNDKRFMRGMGKSSAEAEQNLDEALERAVVRGTLLRAAVTLRGGETHLYFLNSPRGRAALEGLAAEKWHPEDLPLADIELETARPNIFQLYETHIGPLTPLMADTLRQAEETYPQEWIADAMRIAVENNVRRWRYVAAILQSWAEEGRDERKDRSGTEEDRRRSFKKLAKRLRK
jgi:DnaD/phage-associated family protein